jgi:hypothetical protein
MNIIETTAPIAIDYLKEFFTNKDETSFLIDYENSQLQGSKLLVYLSNLDVPCDIKVDEGSESFNNLISDYLNSPFVLNIKTLEIATINILLARRGIVETDAYNNIIDANKEILDRWEEVLDSLALFNMYTLDNEEVRENIRSVPANTYEDLKGINFVSLLKHEDFYEFFSTWKLENARYFDGYFNDYMFKGKNLYSYWANENNPMFLLTFGIAENIDINEYAVEE